jgi:hypothetical protein
VVGGLSERDTTFKGGARNILSPFLKVPRQCPFVLPVETRSMEGRCWEVNKDKGLGSGLRYEQRREGQGLYCI